MQEEHVIDLFSSTSFSNISYENSLLEGKFSFGHEHKVNCFSQILSKN
jgi:hypothetical protein